MHGVREGRGVRRLMTLNSQAPETPTAHRAASWLPSPTAPRKQRPVGRSFLQSSGHFQTDRRINDDGLYQPGEICVLDPDCVNVSTRIKDDLGVFSQRLVHIDW